MHHYTVGWDDSKHIHHEICEYAEDSWHAAQYAKEDVPYLRGHPFSINEIFLFLLLSSIANGTILTAAHCDNKRINNK